MNSKIIVAGLIITGLLGISVAAVVFIKYTPSHQQPIQESIPLSQEQTKAPAKIAQQDTVGTSTSPQPLNTPGDVSIKTSLKSIQKREPIYVNWITPKSINSLHLFIKEDYNVENSEKYYKVGTVTEGKYQDGSVIIANIMRSDAPEDYSTGYYLIEHSGTFTMILKNSDGDLSALDAKMVTVDNTSEFPDLSLPLKITYGKSTFNFWNKSTTPSFDEESKNWRRVFTYNNSKDIYTNDQDSIFYMRAPDGTIGYYVFVIDFSGENTPLYDYGSSGFIPKLTWSDGVINTASYFASAAHGIPNGGCGNAIISSTTTEIMGNDLAYAGITANKDPVYQPKNINHPLLRGTYDAYVNNIKYINDMNNYYSESRHTAVSYNTFISTHPVFFWADPFGHFIQFVNNDFITHFCEKGKPVIYLYPQTTERVSVQVAPEGGISKSDPEYKNGWDVIAKPDGQLFDVTTGTAYPYLFWESPGWGHPAPKRGFIVADKDIKWFLVEKLTKLGLNQQESSDFMDFWEPKLKGSPYFFISFLGNMEMGKIAPLSVNPKPDSIIRIFMYYTPLQNPISVIEPIIKTPERTGFILVEWGGLLQ